MGTDASDLNRWDALDTGTLRRVVDIMRRKCGDEVLPRDVLAAMKTEGDRVDLVFRSGRLSVLHEAERALEGRG